MKSKRMPSVVVFLSLFSLFPLCNAIDTITKTQFVSDSGHEFVLSSNGKFRLGFFDGSPGKYIGIWFNKVTVRTVVWVANREAPIKNSSGIFKIADDGNLAVFDGKTNSPVWSTNISMSSPNSTAKLLSSGNLVLLVRNESSNTETVVWQSFDHPTDTLLSEMKFGLIRSDHIGEINQVLTSWKSSEDPSPGEFQVKFNVNGLPQIFQYKNNIPMWRGGPWNGQTLSGIPKMSNKLKTSEMDLSKVDYLFNYTFVHNQEETFITFHDSDASSSVFSRQVLEVEGIVRRVQWHEESKQWIQVWVEPDDVCGLYARCGSYGICNSNSIIKCSCMPGFEPRQPQTWPFDCIEKRKYQCGKGPGEGFVKISNVKLPDASRAQMHENLTLKECEQFCLKNCSCRGYASADLNSGLGCLVWHVELKDMQQYADQGQDFYHRVDAFDLAAYKKEESKSIPWRRRTIMIVIVSAVVGIVSVMIGVLLLISTTRHRKKQIAKTQGQKGKQSGREILLLDSDCGLAESENSPGASQCNESINSELTFFDLNSIVAATDNFSQANKLGQGGFGPVYKGKLLNGQEIAIKRLSKDSGQGMVEFKNEVLLIAKLQHRNLVRLIGCCIEEDERSLIYEYMPNRSLDYFIFDQSKKELVQWEKRFEIILGVARGILYLHQDSRLRIIHRDLKTSNILLDGEMNPKISDFGTARIFGGNQSHANTRRVVGTFGYMSPEYALDGLFSTKSDVFSFGVMVLEIITGQKNGGYFQDNPSSNLIRHVWNLWEDEKALEAVDSTIRDSCSELEVLRCIQVGLLCVQDSADSRPEMSTVVFMLSNEMALPSPQHPAFAIMRTYSSEPLSATTGTNSSTNNITVTELDAR